MMCIIDR